MHREDTLPTSIRAGSAVRKGTVLTFRRDPGGQLSASANALPLVTVRSAPLASAVFDIYFGEQPVSKRAKKVRRARMHLLSGGGGQAAAPGRHDLARVMTSPRTGRFMHTTSTTEAFSASARPGNNLLACACFPTVVLIG